MRHPSIASLRHQVDDIRRQFPQKAASPSPTSLLTDASRTPSARSRSTSPLESAGTSSPFSNLMTAAGWVPAVVPVGEQPPIDREGQRVGAKDQGRRLRARTRILYLEPVLVDLPVLELAGSRGDFPEARGLGISLEGRPLRPEEHRRVARLQPVDDQRRCGRSGNRTPEDEMRLFTLENVRGDGHDDRLPFEVRVACTQAVCVA